MPKSELVSPSIVAEMKAELESLSNTEPGAKDVSKVVAELMPLIQGCRDRGHSWKRIAESLNKFHSDLSVGRLKKFAFELDPSLKGNLSSQKSLIPDMNEDKSESIWPPDSIEDEDEVESNWLPDLIEIESKSTVKTKTSKALNFEDNL